MSKATIEIGIGDVDYSELSESLKFTVVLNQEAVDCVVESLFVDSDLITHEEVALAAKDILHRGIIMDVTRGGMKRRLPVNDPLAGEES